MIRTIILVAVAGLAVCRVSAQDNPLSDIKQKYMVMKPWLADTQAVRRDLTLTSHRFDDVFDWKEMTIRVFTENWVNLTKSWQEFFIQGVRKKVIDRLSGYILSNQASVRKHTLSWRNDEITGHRGKVLLDVLEDQDISRVTLRISDQTGEWKIFDIRSERFSLVKNYFRGLDSLLSDGYNPEYVLAVMSESPDIIIESFSSRSSEGFPVNWGWRKKDDNVIHHPSGTFQIAEEDTNRYLSIKIHDVPLVRPFCYNIAEYPALKWKWRLSADTAYAAPRTVLASLTVIFYQNWLGLPVTITYAWHGRDARCTSYRERQWFVDRHTLILRGSSDSIGEWREETVNPLSDYQRLFGEEPPLQTVAFYFQIHLTDTPWVRRLDVDDLRASRGKAIFSCP